MNVTMLNFNSNALRARFMNADRSATSNAIMALINVLQDMPVQQQVTASACLFALFARRFKESASSTEFLELADRILGTHLNPEFIAARAYMRNEW
jgi:hypothetical protein